MTKPKKKSKSAPKPKSAQKISPPKAKPPTKEQITAEKEEQSKIRHAIHGIPDYYKQPQGVTILTSRSVKK
jgi:hypothetical protein